MLAFAVAQIDTDTSETTDDGVVVDEDDSSSNPLVIIGMLIALLAIAGGVGYLFWKRRTTKNSPNADSIKPTKHDEINSSEK